MTTKDYDNLYPGLTRATMRQLGIAVGDTAEFAGAVLRDADDEPYGADRVIGVVEREGDSAYVRLPDGSRGSLGTWRGKQYGRLVAKAGDDVPEEDPRQRFISRIIAAWDEHERATTARRRKLAAEQREPEPAADERADVMRKLRDLAVRRIAAEEERAAVMDEARPLIQSGRALGIGPAELAAVFSTTRRTIYDITGKDG